MRARNIGISQTTPSPPQGAVGCVLVGFGSDALTVEAPVVGKLVEPVVVVEPGAGVGLALRG